MSPGEGPRGSGKPSRLRHAVKRIETRLSLRRRLGRHRPPTAQGHALNRMAGACRWVWDWALRRWKDHYAATGKSIPMAQLSAELTALKQRPETARLREADSQALQQVLADLHRAFTNSFENRARSPKFKSRKRDSARFRIPQRVEVKDGKVTVPKIGDVRIFQSRDVTEKTKSATFKRAANGKWYVCLVVEELRRRGLR